MHRPSEHSRGRGPPRLALASLRDYNKPLLFIPGAFLIPRAVLRNRRTSRVRSGALLCPGMRGSRRETGVPLATAGRSLSRPTAGRGAPAAQAIGTARGARTMDAITQVLNAIEQGDPHAASQL